MRSPRQLASKLATLLLELVFATYRLVISPVLHLLAGPGYGCRFQPSCSEYSREAIRRFGPLRGSYLSIKRILRCNPFGGSGHDPLPQ